MLKTRNFYLILLSLQAPILLGALFYILTSNPFILTSDAFMPAFKSVVNVDKEITAVSITRVMEAHSKKIFEAPVERVTRVATLPKKEKVIVKAPSKKISIKKTQLPKIEAVKETARVELTIKDKSIHELADTKEFTQYGINVDTTQVETLSWSNYFNSTDLETKLAALKSDEEVRVAEAEVIEQTVSEKQASVTASNTQEFNNDEEADALNILLKETESKNPASDELVMIDYSNSYELGDSTSQTKNDGPVVISDEELLGEYANLLDNQNVAATQPAVETESAPQVSDTVMSVIARNQDQLLAEVDPSLLTTQMGSQIKKIGAAPKSEEKRSYSLGGDEETDTQSEASSFVGNDDHRLVIQALVAKNGQELSQKAYNYEFIPSFNPALSLYDNAEGEVVINGNLHSETALLSGSLVKAGFVRTRIEIPVERGFIAQPIAFLEQETLLGYFESENLNGGGGHLLVQLNEQMDNVEIDAQYEAKLYLDEKLKIVKDVMDSTHILFIGVAPGNLTITYVHGQSNTTKVIGVYEDEVFVDTPVLKNQAPSNVKLIERNLMGKNATDLLIDGDKMKSFQSGKSAIPMAYNNYEIDHGMRPVGMRNYLEFTHLGPYILGGHGEKAMVEVPSRDYMENIMRIFSVEDLSTSCMVQINFSDNVQSVDINAEGARGGIDYDSLYLDRDGVFNKDASELASKLFLSGHEQGIFYISVNYQDGSKDIFKTFCSVGTYLFEQL